MNEVVLTDCDDIGSALTSASLSDLLTVETTQGTSFTGEVSVVNDANPAYERELIVGEPTGEHIVLHVSCIQQTPRGEPNHYESIKAYEITYDENYLKYCGALTEVVAEANTSNTAETRHY